MYSECPVLLQCTPTTARPAATASAPPTFSSRRRRRGEERKPAAAATFLRILRPAAKSAPIPRRLRRGDRNLRSRPRHPRGDEPLRAALLHLEEEVLRLELLVVRRE